MQNGKPKDGLTVNMKDTGGKRAKSTDLSQESLRRGLPITEPGLGLLDGHRKLKARAFAQRISTRRTIKARPDRLVGQRKAGPMLGPGFDDQSKETYFT
jgi:hypothetical protein